MLIRGVRARKMVDCDACSYSHDVPAALMTSTEQSNWDNALIEDAMHGAARSLRKPGNKTEGHCPACLCCGGRWPIIWLCIAVDCLCCPSIVIFLQLPEGKVLPNISERHWHRKGRLLPRLHRFVPLGGAMSTLYSPASVAVGRCPPGPVACTMFLLAWRMVRSTMFATFVIKNASYSQSNWWIWIACNFPKTTADHAMHMWAGRIT